MNSQQGVSDGHEELTPRTYGVGVWAKLSPGPYHTFFKSKDGNTYRVPEEGVRDGWTDEQMEEHLDLLLFRK